MKVYEKWRELKTNPDDISFKKIKIIKQISFPPCGNDVVECECLVNNQKTNVFIKIERSTKAAFDIEEKHLNLLLEKDYYAKIPQVIETGKIKDKNYLVLEKVEGYRLSDIFSENIKEETKNQYLINYGKELAKIHQIPYELFTEARQRSINDIPQEEKYQGDLGIITYINYLKENKPLINLDTFIHGDFHYANILWQKENISGILDWEYSGKGFKEQDIAWACILRSTQKFMDNIEDIKYFLQGYKSIGNYDKAILKWCMINGYCHFYLMFKDDKEYQNKLKKLLLEIYKWNYII